MDNTPSNVKSHIVSIHGRGANHCFLVKGETQDIANKCQPAVDSGFEVYVYLIEASKLGSPGYAPTGGTNLRRVYHLFDAMDKFHDEIRSTIESLDAHSITASIKYVDHMTEELVREKAKLVEMMSPSQILTVMEEMKQPQSEVPEDPANTATGS